jgi:hypothetical protein
MEIVKVKYENQGTGGTVYLPREYSYYTVDPLNVGDIVTVPMWGGNTGKARVSAINVPESEIASFKDKMKTIPAGAVIKTTPEPAETQPDNLLDFYPDVEAEFEQATKDLGDTMVSIRIRPETDVAVENLKTEIIKLSNYATSRVIKSDTDLTPATNDMVLVAKLKKALKEKQNEYAQPIKDHLARVQVVFNELLGILSDIEAINKAKVTAYTDAQKARVAEAERLNREAMELARKQAEFSGTGEITVDTTTLEAPAPVRHVSTGSGSISEVKAPSTWELENWDLVPNQYKLLDTVRIGQIVRAGGSIPGIKVITHTTIRTTTK